MSSYKSIFGSSGGTPLRTVTYTAGAGTHTFLPQTTRYEVVVVGAGASGTDGSTTLSGVGGGAGETVETDGLVAGRTSMNYIVGARATSSGTPGSFSRFGPHVAAGGALTFGSQPGSGMRVAGTYQHIKRGSTTGGGPGSNSSAAGGYSPGSGTNGATSGSYAGGSCGGDSLYGTGGTGGNGNETGAGGNGGTGVGFGGGGGGGGRGSTGGGYGGQSSPGWVCVREFA